MWGAVLAPGSPSAEHSPFRSIVEKGEATMLVANFCAEMALFGYEVCLIADDDNLPALRGLRQSRLYPQGSLPYHLLQPAGVITVRPPI